jgi:pyrrolysine biosynthesis protein PylD
MTRLVETDIAGLTEKLGKYDQYLKEVCGKNLAAIAKSAANKTETSPKTPRVAVVPITSGMGIIKGFPETVAGIANFLGYSARVTNDTDIAGIAEALRDRCDIFMAADDDAFIAANFQKRLVSDNSEATGRGYAAALSLAAGGLAGKDVLLLGAGPVGQSAASSMLHDGARLTVYDIDMGKADSLKRSHPVAKIARNLDAALSEHSLIFDATPTGAFIRKESLRQDAILSAPGVPLCLDSECEEWMRGRVLHDSLEIGVATMLFDVT